MGFLIAVLFFSAMGHALGKEADKVNALIKQEIVRRDPSLVNAKIEVSFKNAKELSAFPEHSFKLSYPENMFLSGDVVVPVDVYYGAELRKKINIRASVRIFRNVVVSTGRIKQGDVFSLKNTGYAEKDVTHLPASYITDSRKALGMQASTFIPKGALILDWMPKAVPAIKRGETVELFKKINGVFVKVKAVAVEDGYISGNIRVRNAGSNKVVEGTVKSTGEVEAI